MPSRCACGAGFTLTHALHCPKGGFTIVRHNEIRDTFAELLQEVCHDVQIEPLLQPLTGEEFERKTTTTDDEARLDIKANGLWGTRFERTFFDVKIFNPLAVSCPKTVKTAYKYHESIKKAKYEPRIIEIEGSTFCPLIFAATGGAAPAATKVIRKIAEKLSDKKKERYSDVITFIRTKLSFALLRSSVLCIRGCRSLKRPQIIENSINENSKIRSYFIAHYTRQYNTDYTRQR